ncbi:hypothetical protein GCM10023237_01190 [Streptomyces coeruleoprunus]
MRTGTEIATVTDAQQMTTLLLSGDKPLACVLGAAEPATGSRWTPGSARCSGTGRSTFLQRRHLPPLPPIAQVDDPWLAVALSRWRGRW